MTVVTIGHTTSLWGALPPRPYGKALQALRQGTPVLPGGAAKRIRFNEDSMEDTLQIVIGVGFIAGYFALNGWILPKLGIST